MLNDDYGDSSAEQILEDRDRWFVLTAAKLTETPSRREDVAQEGRVAFWKAWHELADEPQRISFSLNKAKQRMQQFAWYESRTPPTGNLHEGPRYEPKSQMSIQQKESEVEGATGGDDADTFAVAVFGLVDRLDDIEWAYHSGEIAAAISALTPKQRQYVYARFWCGMDAADGMHANLGIREARNNNPYLRRDVLWTGNKTSAGAKKVLAERLAHLRDLVSA